MKLRRLRINRLPGINVPFEIVPQEATVHVVIGPNGIGKSSLCRAVEALYWSDLEPSQRISVNGEFELDGETWWAEREGSRVRWQHNGAESTPPNLPASYNHNCFFLRLRDLIDPSTEGTRNVASEIRRQMLGGFDLDKIVSDLFSRVGERHGLRERKQFNEAQLQIQQVEGEHTGLQRRADELDSLKVQFAKAESSGSRLTHVTRALGLAGRRRELACVTEELSVLPVNLANLTGKELNHIENYQSQVQELSSRMRTLEAQLAKAGKDQLDSGLETPLALAQLMTWRENSEQLSRFEVELDAARNEYSSVHAELEGALFAIGGSKVDKVELDLHSHSQLFEFLRATEKNKIGVDAVEERLRLLVSLDVNGERQRALEKLLGPIETLRSWLRAPEPESISGGKKARHFWMIAAATLFVVGVSLALAVDPIISVIAAIGVGIGLPVFLGRSRQAGPDQRQVAQDAFEKSGVNGAPVWENSSVEEYLRDLESKAANLDAQIKRERDRDVDRRSLKNKLEILVDAQPGLDDRRQELQASLNLDEIPPDAELIDFALSLDQLRLARSKDNGAKGKVNELEKRHAELLSFMAGMLVSHGEVRPTDATTTMALLNQLTDRDAKFKKAIADKQTAADQLQQATSDHDTAAQLLAQVYSGAGLETNDLHGLTTLLNSLPSYMEQTRARTRLETQVQLDQAELAKAHEGDLCALDELALGRLNDELSRAAEKVNELRDEIASINAQVDSARSGHGIQELIATQNGVLANLHECRSEALYEQTGRFLMNDVEQEHEQTQMPRVLERARELFSAFTHHHYELRLGSGKEEAKLIAIDLQSSEGLSLEKLSDGTRVQLLLAARIAFAEDVEQGRTLPLFLDEALDQSDPARFEAIVSSLGRVAKDQGRQIFYLTSDPADVGRIKHALDMEKCDAPAVIDLGLVRADAASVSGPSALHVDPRSSVLTPNGMSADEYGAALGVQPLDPSFGYAHQHFFHLLWDDLDLLHKLLTHGIERAGQWKTVLGTALAVKLGAHSKSPEEIALRSELLEIFCAFWNQGHGRPVDREVLEDSCALSKRFLDPIADIARELDGDAKKLLNVIRSREDERLSGFRTSSVEKLEQYMRENGYLDEQPILDKEELRLQALASPAATRLPEGVADECLNRWWILAARTIKPEAAKLN
jgi:exonuclease SbcC